MNGSALTAGQWPEIDAIWADAPDIPGATLNISDLITAGQSLGDWRRPPGKGAALTTFPRERYER